MRRSASLNLLAASVTDENGDEDGVFHELPLMTS
jgi:hypothetical protein